MAAAHGGTSKKVVEGREAFAPVETHLIRSKYVAQTFKVQVARPTRKPGENVRFPVVYATDANFTFDTLKGIAYSMQLAEHISPRFILVGIGYPSDTPWAGALLRGRDLTFAGYPKNSREPLPWAGLLLPPEGGKDFHGAEDFQQFMANELFPLIDEGYQTIPEDRTYFGHSAGGSFGLGTLFTRPELFRNYVVSSPALYIHGESSAGIHYERHEYVLEYARRFTAAGRSLDGIRAYMSIGDEEEFEPDLGQYQLTSSFYRTVATLQSNAPTGLTLRAEVFAGESHMTIWPMAFVHGVQTVFGTKTWGKEVGASVRPMTIRTAAQRNSCVTRSVG